MLSRVIEGSIVPAWRRSPKFGQLCRCAELILCASGRYGPLAIILMYQVRALVAVCRPDGVILILNVWRIDLDIFEEHAARWCQNETTRTQAFR